MKRIEINKRVVEYSDYDTSNVLRQRIAYAFHTLPEFISPIDNMENEQKVSMLLYDVYTTPSGKIVDDTSSTLSDFLRKHMLEESETYVFLWITYSNAWKSMREGNPEDDVLQLEIMSKISDSGIDKYVNVFDFFNTIRDSRKDTENQVRKFEEEYKSFWHYYNQLQTYPSVFHTDFIKKSSSLIITTNITRNMFSLHTIFSKMNCSSVTPFMSFNNIFKMDKNFYFTIPELWKKEKYLNSTNLMNH